MTRFLKFAKQFVRICLLTVPKDRFCHVSGELSWIVLFVYVIWGCTCLVQERPTNVTGWPSPHMSATRLGLGFNFNLVRCCVYIPKQLLPPLHYIILYYIASETVRASDGVILMRSSSHAQELVARICGEPIKPKVKKVGNSPLMNPSFNFEPAIVNIEGSLGSYSGEVRMRMKWPLLARTIH